MNGQNPALISQMSSGFAVLAENQYLPGYCLLLANPLVGQLLDLSVEAQHEFLSDMARLGHSIKAATGCLRVNFGIYGNVDPFLHAHVWPRYADETEDLRTVPPLQFPLAVRTSPDTTFSTEVYGELQRAIKGLLED